MEVKILSSKILSHGTIDAPSYIPFTIFDLLASDMHMAVIFTFSPPSPSNDVLSRGLVHALRLFPTLTGKLIVDPPGIDLSSSGGALLVEAEVDADLSDHAPLPASLALSLLHPHAGPPSPENLLQVQLNRFSCGGLVIGMTMHHRVADGSSAGNFVAEWGKAVSGVGGEEMCHRRFHVYDRSWLRPREPPRCEYEHWGVDFMAWEGERRAEKEDKKVEMCDAKKLHFSREFVMELCNVKLHFSREFIDRELKGRMRERKHTTFQVLLGHLWRKISMARRLEQGESTQLGISTNGRRRLIPPISPDYFGNLVTIAYPRSNVEDLLDMGVVGAAKLIQDAVSTKGDGYFRSLIDFGALHEHEKGRLVPTTAGDGPVLSPNLEAHSWLGFRFTEVNLGANFGGLLDFGPSWIPVEGVIVLVPSVNEEGVDVTVTLMEEDARLLKEISHKVE